MFPEVIRHERLGEISSVIAVTHEIPPFFCDKVAGDISILSLFKAPVVCTTELTEPDSNPLCTFEIFILVPETILLAFRLCISCQNVAVAVLVRAVQCVSQATVVMLAKGATTCVAIVFVVVIASRSSVEEQLKTKQLLVFMLDPLQANGGR